MKYNRDDKQKWGIYAIRNKVDKKMYIGKSKNIHARMLNHVSNLNRKSLDENRYLINAWFKHGKENFEYFVIEYLVENVQLLEEKELFWILHFDTVNPEKGYNLRLDSSSNMIVHEETKKLKSKNRKKYYEDNSFLKEKISLFFSQFWKENPDVKDNMAKKVSETNKNYTIVQLTRNLETIKEFDSQKEIRDNYPDLYLPAILQVCNGNKASYKGYYWRYRDIKTGQILFQRERRTMKVPVVMIDKETNFLLMEFSSCEEAGKHIGQTKGGNISTMCSKKLFWKNKPFYFRYKHDFEDIVQL